MASGTAGSREEAIAIRAERSGGAAPIGDFVIS